MQSMRDTQEPSPLSNGTWSHAMLWVQDKLLVRCNNSAAEHGDSDIDSHDLLVILIHVQDFLKEQTANVSTQGKLPTHSKA